MKTWPVISIIIVIVLVHSNLVAQNILVPADFHPQHNPVVHSTIEDLDKVLISECLGVDGQTLVFDLEIRNLSLNPVHVHAETISLMVSDTPFPSSQSVPLDEVIAFENNLAEYPAMSAEKINRKYRSIIKTRRGIAIALTALAAGLAVFDAAKDAEDWHKSIWTETHLRKSRARDAGVATVFLASDISRHFIGEANARTTGDLRYLEQEILETENLQPMDAVRGKVFFPAKNAKYYRIIVPLGHTQYTFDFKKPNARERKAVKKMRK